MNSRIIGSREVVAGLAALIAVWSLWALAEDPQPDGVDYPSNFRTWQHVKTMLIQPGHPLEVPFGGIHHIYANAKAMRGLSDGQFQDGAVFVFDLLNYVESENTIVEAERRRIDVMQYSMQRFAATGGWGFDSFEGGKRTERVEQDVVTACFDCHQAAKDTNFVYSRYRQ